MKLHFQILLVSLVLLSGCATWKVPTMKMPWSDKNKVDESKYETPARMAVVWTDSVLNVPGKPATRGFGGRIYFFNAKSQSIPVEGQLVVYGYDDTGKKPGNRQLDNRQPDRRFVFTPEQFTQHFGRTELGASYSVWIPWDAAGGDECRISLVPVFSSTSGNKLVGEQSAAVLPGPQSQNVGVHHVQLNQTIEHVAFQQTLAAPAEGDRDPLRPGDVTSSGRTTTINMPRSMTRAMSQTPPSMPAPVPAASMNVGWLPGSPANPYAQQAHQPNPWLPAAQPLARGSDQEAGASGSRLSPSQRVTRFERSGFQAPRGPIARLGHDPASTKPPR